MAVDFKGIELALIKAVRISVGNELSVISSNVSMWDTVGVGFVNNPLLIFEETTYPLAEAARDSYFTANPAQLVLGTIVTIKATGQPATKQIYQRGKAAVIRSRLYDSTLEGTTPPFPDYPYASVDYTSITDEGYELTDRYFDEDDNYIYQAHKIASFSIKFMGTSRDDVMSICNKMHMMLEIDGVRNTIEALSPTEAAVRSKSSPVFIASVMEDKYREIASFDIMMAVLDEVQVLAGEDGSEFIENIVIDTSTPQEGVDGGLFVDSTHVADVLAETNIT